MKNIR